jgi:hypothetical protein
MEREFTSRRCRNEITKPFYHTHLELNLLFLHLYMSPSPTHPKSAAASITAATVAAAITKVTSKSVGKLVLTKTAKNSLLMIRGNYDVACRASPQFWAAKICHYTFV